MNENSAVTLLDSKDIQIFDDEIDIKKLCLIMRQSGKTPYRYIKRSFRYLVDSKYNDALDWINYAEQFCGIFWKEKSQENLRFKEELKLLKITMLFLIEKFSAMPREE